MWNNALMFSNKNHGLQKKLYLYKNFFLRSLRSFTWVSWGYLPSTDISCRPHFRRFIPSFLCCFLFSKWNIYFFILVFSDPILFSLSFPVFYFPCLLLSIFLLCLSFHIVYFLFLSFFVCLLLSFLLSSIDYVQITELHVYTRRHTQS